MIAITSPKEHKPGSSELVKIGYHVIHPRLSESIYIPLSRDLSRPAFYIISYILHATHP